MDWSQLDISHMQTDLVHTSLHLFTGAPYSDQTE